MSLETLLDSVNWERIDATPADTNGLPYATHQGVLTIGGEALRCFRLNDGRAILHADDVHRVFGMETEGGGHD